MHGEGALAGGMERRGDRPGEDEPARREQAGSALEVGAALIGAGPEAGEADGVEPGEEQQRHDHRRFRAPAFFPAAVGRRGGRKDEQEGGGEALHPKQLGMIRPAAPCRMMATASSPEVRIPTRATNERGASSSPPRQTRSDRIPPPTIRARAIRLISKANSPSPGLQPANTQLEPNCCEPNQAKAPAASAVQASRVSRVSRASFMPPTSAPSR